MTFPLVIPEPLRRALPPGTGVLLGLSGGVDSAVALALLQALGCDVQCVTFKNFCYAGDGAEPAEKSCCNQDAVEAARGLARRHGVPYWVSDVSDSFRLKVVDPFISEYAAARTPNPCLVCNSDVRFPELVRLARRQGCRYAATGHYARIVADGDGARLLTGLDPEKDQSYFLHRVDRRLFPDLIFPLGWWRKRDVRRVARELGLDVADRPDSQEICFVPDDDRSFLFADSPAGDIVDRAGTVLGRHRGLHHYTVGQRRRLGVAADRPLYVLALDPRHNRVILGYREELAVTRVRADRFRAAVPDFPDRGPDGPGCLARIRHRHGGVPVAAWQRRGDVLTVDLAEPAEGVAPGQGLVLYAGETVLGGARIMETISPEENAK